MRRGIRSDYRPRRRGSNENFEGYIKFNKELDDITDEFINNSMKPHCTFIVPFETDSKDFRSPEPKMVFTRVTQWRKTVWDDA